MALGRREFLLASVSSLVAGATQALHPAAQGVGNSVPVPRLAFPPPLTAGSHLVAFNPASRIDRPAPWLDGLRRRIEAEGWNLLVPEQVFGRQRWFSASDNQRAQGLMLLWKDQGVNGVLQIGGGWGSARLLEAGWRQPRRPLWSVGFSDASALLLAQLSAGLGGGVHAGLGAWGDDWQRLTALLAGRPVAPLQG
ncbi:LD-carboxypeptidase [Cyanobium sp. Morenito 9A2]|uniref:LD-carboxypeptidase n=1 Tax=Cyanobium sp. Morenito 9A2 TaxID=2823718 RepID=UPI0020CFC1BB|nr:LD-carboxypeptidase [Cyanobium sp. Morenito 9A2]